MDELLKKMNFREGMKIQIWNLPENLQSIQESWKALGYIASFEQKPDFFLAFVQEEADISSYFSQVRTALSGDPLFWFAYPKASSKRYQAEINRDKGWKILGKADFEPVRQVAIDGDWSALRFRKIEYIKKMTRKFSAKD